MFSGKRDEYINWRRQFAAHMRDEKSININKRAADGTLALSDSKKIVLADRLTRALGKLAIMYENDADDGVAMLAALEGRYQHFSAAEQRRVTQKLMAMELMDPTACDDFVVELKTAFQQLANAGQKVGDTQQISYLLGALPEDYTPLVATVESQAGATFDAVLQQVLSFSATLAMRRKRVSTSETNDALMAKHGSPSSTIASSWGGANLKRRKESRTCFNCGVRGHIARNCPQPPRDGRARRTDVPEGQTWRQRRAQGSGQMRAHDHGHQFANIVVGDDAHLHQAQMVDDSNSESAISNAERRDAAAAVWIIDSGCTAHMTPTADGIRNYKPEHGSTVRIANGSDMEVSGRGEIDLTCADENGVPTTLTMSVIHVPSLRFRLLSTSSVQRAGGTIVLGSEPCMHVKKMVIPLERRGDFTVLPTCNTALVSKVLLHRRLCHAGDYACSKANAKTENDEDVEPTASNGKEWARCAPCAAAKMRRTPFPTVATHRARVAGELLHIDHAGPLPTGVEGHKYVLLVVDDATRYSWSFTAATRSDAPEALQRLDAATPFRIQMIRTDNAPELKHGAFSAYCTANGIKRQYTCPHTPQQNGVVERKLAHLFCLVRAMLKDAELPAEWWTFAMRHATYVINRTSTTALPGITPFEALHGKAPDLSALRVWGCAVWVLDQLAAKKGKLVNRGVRGVFLGLASGVKGYVVLVNNRVTTSRHVAFEEEISGGSVLGTEHDEARDTICEVEEEPPEFEQRPANRKATDKEIREPQDDALTDTRANETPQAPMEITTASGRASRPPSEWWCAAAVSEPRTFAQAISDPSWFAAIQEELRNHEEKGTWMIVAKPPGANLVSTKWLFKRKPDGRLKARLVARGFTQRFGIDWHESYAPVTSTLVVRVFAAIACAKDWELYHIDVRAAYLCAEVKEDIYLAPPQGVQVPAGKVCKVLKSIYGLHQSGRNWYHHFTQKLQSIGFKAQVNDPCLLVRGSADSSEFCAIAMYVDDLAVLASSRQLVDDVVETLSTDMVLTHGPMEEYLGIEVERTVSDISLHQRRFIRQLLIDTNMTECRTVSAPTAARRLDRGNEDELTNARQYRSLVGKLLWLATTTRPDIMFAVKELSRYNQEPRSSHMTAARRVLRYLSGTRDACITMTRGAPLELSAYCDADWAGSSDEQQRRSTSGYVFGFGREEGNLFPISWRSGTQSCIAYSAAESEYVALSDATKEATYLRGLLSTIGARMNSPIIVRSDSRSAIAMTAETGLSRSTRHIAVRYHNVRLAISEGVIALAWTPSTAMLADYLTKPMTGVAFRRCVQRIVSPCE